MNKDKAKDATIGNPVYNEPTPITKASQNSEGSLITNNVTVLMTPKHLKLYPCDHTLLHYFAT